MKRWLVAIALCIIASPAAAQDYDPSMSAHESMSQQQFTTQQTQIYNRMLSDSARRHRGGATRGQIAACAQKAKFRAEFGPSNAKVKRLYGLCRQIGH